MKKDLKKRIEEFNRIGYQDNSNRIIFAILESEIKKLEWGVTIANKHDMALVWKDKTITFQHDDEIVTIAPNSTK